MRRSTRWVVIASAVVSIGVGGSVWLSSSRGAAASTGASAAPSATAQQREQEHDNVVLLPLIEQWQRDTRYSYALDYSSHMTGDKEQVVLDLPLRGQLAITRGEDSTQGTIVRFQLLNLELQSGQERAADPEVNKFFGRLQQPIYGVFRRDGALSAFIAPPEPDPTVFGLLGFLVAELQLGAPAAPDASWQMHETDTLGVYDATYQRLPGRRVRREKRRYTKPHDSRAGKIDQLSDQAVFTFADSGVLSHLSARAVLGVATQISHFTSTTGIMARYLSQEPRQGFVVPADWRTFPVRQLSSKAQSQVSTPTQPARHFVEQLRSEPGDPRGFPEVRDALAARITAFPGEIADVIAAIHQATDKHEIARLMGALAHAATPESVRALADLARDENLDPNLRGTAVDNITLMPRSTKESISQLEQLRSDKSLDSEIRASATLGLGAALRAADDATLSNKQRAETQDALAREIGSAENATDKQNAIAALGNAGPAGGVKMLEGPLTASSVGERATAVYALRFVPGPEAEQKIVTAMSLDPAPIVRENAAGALAVRGSISEEAAGALGAALLKEADQAVQHALASAASEHLLAYPALSIPLQALAQRTSDENLRRQIEIILQRADQANAAAADGSAGLPLPSGH